MRSDHKIRASDRDRDVVVETLREAYVVGRLTLEEFNERAAATYASRTWGELRELTADLPVPPVLGADLPGRQPPEVPALPPAPPLPTPPRHLPPRQAPRRRPSALVPFVMIWFLIVLVTRSPVVVATPVVILALVIMATALFRRR